MLPFPPRETRPAQPVSAETWSADLTEALGVPVTVTFGRARRQVLVARPERHGWSLRLHHGFSTAPAEVREAVARWLAQGRRARRACRVLDAWIEELARSIAAEPRRRPPLRPVGRAHDLSRLLALVLSEDLDEEERLRLAPPAVTWARATQSARRSLQLGSYDSELDLVRVHPVLDQEAVPTWFVRFVLFHETLHALHPSRPGGGGRTLHHPPELRARERRHRDHVRANAWQSRHIGALLRSVRTGRPLKAGTRGSRA